MLVHHAYFQMPNVNNPVLFAPAQAIKRISSNLSTCCNLQKINTFRIDFKRLNIKNIELLPVQFDEKLLVDHSKK